MSIRFEKVDGLKQVSKIKTSNISEKGQAFLSAKMNNLVILFSLLFSSCMQNTGSPRSSRTSSSIANAAGKAAGGGQSSDGKNAFCDSATCPSDSILNDILTEGEAELRHIIDPFDGTYKTKVTIPKNYKGFFYLSGINVTSLSNKIVKVRFKFGRELEPITLDATIGKAPGITPQTDIDLLIIDMNNQPFKDVRLIYDLFDYNDYRASTAALVETLEPTEDPRNSGLYCRGLKLEHDPTFTATASNTKCDSSREKCHYSYAKILDAGLHYSDGANYISLIPSKPQIDSVGTGYANLAASSNIDKCLPENISRESFNAVYFPAVVAGWFAGAGAISYDSDVTIGTTTYKYRGPYRAVTPTAWAISSSAIFGAPPATPTDNYPTGLFQYEYSAGLNIGYHSFLFPRASKTSLRSNIQYFGSTDPFNLSGTYISRSLDYLVDSGTTKWMDGCNARVIKYDSYSNESVASCNVSATVELIYIDANGAEVEIPNTKTNKVKLQLIRPSLTNFEGKDVLFSAMKTCSTSNSCGFDECCFNNRCWSKTLVSICPEDATAVGNHAIGQVCSSDFECSSLCCGSSAGTCQVHIRTTQESVLCSKSPGQQCVAKEWCREENVSKCFVVKTGLSPTGKQECALRCYNVPTHGDCIEGICKSPIPPQVPAFDPINPDCSKAITPPTSL